MKGNILSQHLSRGENEMKWKGFYFLVVAMLIFAGCAKEQESREGYVLKVSEGSILIVQKITLEGFNDVKDVPSEALIDQGGLELIWVTYDKAEEFEKGDHVLFLLVGGVKESYPEQAEAKKVERK
jgi:hypothetical protein